MTRTMEPEGAVRSAQAAATSSGGGARASSGASASPVAVRQAADWSSSVGGRTALADPEEMEPSARVAEALKTVSICDTQPVTAEGIRTLLAGNQELRFLAATDSLRIALEHVRQDGPDVLLLDKAFGIQAILDWLSDLRAMEVAGTPLRTNVVVWGVSVTEAEALRFLQVGARGILRKTAGVPVVLACLRTVAAGRSWMEDCVFRDASRAERYPRSELTSREQQVLELVEQGFKNKEIAQELGIRPGTVKIHLKHIFEKTGVRGRYGLALSGLKERGLVSTPA
jgi:two-component system nitrate/nitrite response regulator NarL